jgi:hypothetical protein
LTVGRLLVGVVVNVMTVSMLLRCCILGVACGALLLLVVYEALLLLGNRNVHASADALRSHLQPICFSIDALSQQPRP